MGKDKVKITVISTFAEDKIVKGGSVNVSKGGPAYYITKLLKREGEPFDLISGDEVKVEIIVDDKGEFGRIDGEYLKKIVDLSEIDTPFCIFSTVLNEISIINADKYRGKIFLDVQGLVRDGSKFGGKKKWSPDTSLAELIYCLKATEQESEYIDPAFLENQKQRILLVTKGVSGVLMYSRNQSLLIAPDKIIKSGDNIGAGDTFLAGCILGASRNLDSSNFVKYGMCYKYAFKSKL